MSIEIIDTSVVISDSFFDSNQVSTPLLFIQDQKDVQTNITLINTQFSSNSLSSVNNCNGLVFIDNTYSSFILSNFISNIISCPKVSGGAIRITNNVKEMIISDNTILQNNVIIGEYGYGAALYSEIPLNLSRITLSNNTLKGESIIEGFCAALYFNLQNNEENNIIINESIFIKNSIIAQSPQSTSFYSGAALYVNLNDNPSANFITISNSTFDENQIISKVSPTQNLFIIRYLSGSTIAVESTERVEESLLTISNSNITGYILTDGCFMYQIEGGLIFSSISIELNQTNIFNSQLIAAKNTKEINGGMIYSDISAAIYHCEIFNNTITTLKADCQTQSLKSARKGGIIYTPLINIEYSSLYNNTVFANEVEGGGIWVQSGSFLSSSFFSNIAISFNDYFASGGAIWSEYSSLSMTNLTFVDNQANYGGAITIGDLSSYPISSNLNFTNNKATHNGGAIFILTNQLGDLNCSMIFDGYMENNENGYGGDCGSSAKSLEFYRAPIKEVFPSETFSIELVLRDWFDQSVINPLMSVTISPSKYLSIGIENVYTIYPDNDGVYSYNSLSLYSSPNTNNSLYFTTEIETNIQIEDTFNRTSIFTGNCPATLYYQYTPTSQLSSCLSCGDGKYNLDGNSCIDCPLLPYPSSSLNCVELFSYVDQSHMNNGYQYYDHQDEESVSNAHYLKISEGWWPNEFKDPDYLIACPYEGACLPIFCIFLPNNLTDWTIQCEECSSPLNISSLFDNYYYNYNNKYNYINNNQYYKGEYKNESGEFTCDYCNEGYTETFCSQCECNSIHDCYYISNDQCIQCTVYSITNGVILVIGIIATIIIIPVIILIPKTTIFWILIGLIGLTLVAFAGLISWYYSSLMLIILFCYFFMEKKLPEGIVKCLFFYLQIISSIVTLNAWPPAYRGLIQSFQIANLEISFLSCFWPSLLSDPLHLFILFNLIVPILVLLLSVILILESLISFIPFIRSIRSSIQSRLSSFGILKNSDDNDSDSDDDDFNNNNNGDRDHLLSRDSNSINNENDENNSNFMATFSMEQIISPTDDKKKIMRERISKISKLVLSICSAAYLPISLMAFSVITCEDGYMDEYRWIPCSFSSSYIIFLIISITVILLFVILYPVVLFIILTYYRASNEFHAVFDNYRDGWRILL